MQSSYTPIGPVDDLPAVLKSSRMMLFTSTILLLLLVIYLRFIIRADTAAAKGTQFYKDCHAEITTNIPTLDRSQNKSHNQA